jgi:glutamate-5-semialdehyde dehydrogenase
MPVVYGGNRVTRVSPELAAAFRSGDRLLVLQDTGDLLHIPEADWEAANRAVDAAVGAFPEMSAAEDERITRFFEAFADRLADQDAFEPIAEANRTDVEQARERGRSVTRLVLSDKMRTDMVEGLRLWAGLSGVRGRVVEEVDHPGWKVELRQEPLGTVGFVFEGRPNVFADATGLLRSGNTVVFRIGSDALGTARAIVEHALEPALRESGLPSGAVSLVDSPSRASGWAMFSDPRLSLAVARGSGAAVAQLGSVARQAGTPVSLHGTGGAWLVASDHADPRAFSSAVYHSLDRKVCNTLNTCCIVSSRVDDLLPLFLDALRRAGERRGAHPKLHVVAGQETLVPDEWRRPVPIRRADGERLEPQTEPLEWHDLAVEWEWEDSPEVTLAIVESVDHAVELFNRYSPRFVISLISDRPEEHEYVYRRVDAPFVGNGFTRWVDGQFALRRPELGLSNWQFGRLFGRGGILTGDGVYTVRTRAVQEDPHLGR